MQDFREKTYNVINKNKFKKRCRFSTSHLVTVLFALLKNSPNKRKNIPSLFAFDCKSTTFLINPHTHIVSQDFNYNIGFLYKASFVAFNVRLKTFSLVKNKNHEKKRFHPNLRYYMHECTRLKEKQKDSEAMAKSHNIL